MKTYKKVSTFSTVLETKHNENVIEYFEDTVFDYSTMKRHTLHIIKNNPEIKENILNKYLQDKYGVTTRTANSCIKEVKGIVSSALALLSSKIEKIENRIKNKRKNLETKKKQLAKIHNGRKTNTKKLRKLKFQIYNICNSINGLEQKKKTFQERINQKKPNICLGTKKLLKQNRNKFIKQRDSQISYVGRKEESSGNQMFQFSYNKKTIIMLLKSGKTLGNGNLTGVLKDTWKEDVILNICQKS